MSIIVDIADGVVAALNQHEFTQDFEAVRAYQPKYTLEAMDQLHVTVVPKARTAQNASRSQRQYDVQIDVALQQRIDPGDITRADVLTDLVEEIDDFLSASAREICPTARLVQIDNTPIFAPEHLEQMNQFTSLLTLTFRLFRDQ